MLSQEDVERVLDVAEEFGIDIKEEDVRELWENYSKACGSDNEPLPFSSERLAEILSKEVAGVS